MLLSGLYIFTLTDFTKSTPASVDKNKKKAENVFIFKYRCPILLAVGKDKEAIPHSFFLINFDSDLDKVSLIKLPQKCALSNENEPCIILSESVARGGMSNAVKDINSFFSLNISKYIVFTEGEFEILYDKLSPIKINIPEAMAQLDEEKDIYIKLDEGKQLLTSVSFIDFMKYSNWSEGENMALSEGSELFAEFLRQNSKHLKDKKSDILKNTVLESKTNISVAEFEKYRDFICFLLSNPKKIIPLKAKGKYEKADTVFYLSSASKKLISENF